MLRIFAAAMLIPFTIVGMLIGVGILLYGLVMVAVGGRRIE